MGKEARIIYILSYSWAERVAFAPLFFTSAGFTVSRSIRFKITAWIELTRYVPVPI